MTTRTSDSGWMPGKSGTGWPWRSPKVAGTDACPKACMRSG